MPYVSVKCYPGRTEEQKKQLAEKITRDVMEVFNAPAEHVSVSIQDVAPDKWQEQVYDTEIVNVPDSAMYKKSGETL